MNYQNLRYANYVTLKRNSIEALNPVNSVILPYKKSLFERLSDFFKIKPLRLKEIYLKPRIIKKSLPENYLRKMLERIAR